MKTWLTLILFCLYSIAFAAPLQDHTIDPKALYQLTSTFGISQDENMIAQMQKHWLRKQGKERWEMEEMPTEQEQFVLKWAEEQGVFSEKKPSCKFYDKALILGSTTFSMQKRLNYLTQLWNEGVRFRKIVWLTGDRPLDKEADGLLGRCKNESEAACRIWEETDLPKDMRKLPVVFVAVPMKSEGGTLIRPNTEDTILAWLKVEPEACRALFVSSQPYCGYQFAIIKANLPEKFLFDVVGPRLDRANYPSAAVILDSIARWLYQEKKPKYQ